MNAFNLPNTVPERPTSRNPFLDQSEKRDQTFVSVRPTSPRKDLSKMTGRVSPTKPALTGHAAELFVSHSIYQEARESGIDIARVT